MRNKVIVGNWKMNKGLAETLEFCESFVEFAKEAASKNVICGVAPTFICLPVATNFSESMIISAQNCHYKESGAYTGEVSVSMLDNLGIRYAIVGHSERRKYNNETSLECNKKIKELLIHSMTPIYCVGETLEEYEAGLTKDVVKKQISEGLEGLSTKDFDSFIIAYEPVWSIGTGKNASVEIAQDTCKFIRDLVCELISKEASEKVIIQYGGSVKENNAKEYLSQKDIDGCLVGGASLDCEAFKNLVSKAF